MLYQTQLSISNFNLNFKFQLEKATIILAQSVQYSKNLNIRWFCSYNYPKYFPIVGNSSSIVGSHELMGPQSIMVKSKRSHSSSKTPPKTHKGLWRQYEDLQRMGLRNPPIAKIKRVKIMFLNLASLHLYWFISSINHSRNLDWWSIMNPSNKVISLGMRYLYINSQNCVKFVNERQRNEQ